MNKKFIFFNVFAALSAIMPFRSSMAMDCKDTVSITAGQKWMGGSAVMMRSMADEEELKVEDDTVIYKKHKNSISTITKTLNEKSKQELDKVIPDTASGTIECDRHTISYDKCRGKTLQQCDPEGYKICLSMEYRSNEINAEKQARSNYVNEMIETICGAPSLSATEKKAIEDEKKIQSSGMVSDSTPATSATQESSAPADTEEKKDKAPETKKTSAKNKTEKTVVKPNEKTKRESARADKTSEKKGLCTNAAEHHLLAKYVNGECIVESCVANYEVSEDKKSCVPTQKKLDRDTEKTAKKDADAKDKEMCENTIGGKYTLGACWCGATKVTDISKTCQQLDDEKQAKKDADKADRDTKKQERENQRAEEKAQKAEANAKEKAECENTIGGKYTLGACWCGTTKITDKSKTCEQIKNDKDTKKDQAKIEKEAKRIASKADSLSVGDSLTYETELENDLTVGEALSKWESQCEAKTLALDGGAEYSIETTNAGGQTTITCVITNCTDDEYTVATNKKSCTKNANSCADDDTKCNKAATKAETKLEKEFETDMNVLHTEFLSIIKSLINECKTKGGTIADSGECQVASQK